MNTRRDLRPNRPKECYGIDCRFNFIAAWFRVRDANVPEHMRAKKAFHAAVMPGILHWVARNPGVNTSN